MTRLRFVMRLSGRGVCLEAVFAAIAGYLVLNQTLTGRAIVGCFLILLGVLMVQLVPLMRRKKA